MKKTRIIFLFIVILFSFLPQQKVAAQETKQPVVIVSNYFAKSEPTRGGDFEMGITFLNSGKRAAYNLMIEFIPGELIPRDNGGIQTIYQLIAGESKGIAQNFSVSADLWGAQVASTTVNIQYTDDKGNAYSDTFTLVVDLYQPPYVAAQATPTPTPAPIIQPQLVIESYETDQDILQPGSTFELTLRVKNLGNAPAKTVSLVLGGGNIEINPEGTPQPGVSGSGGDFANFAPLESSNIKYIGDILPGETVVATQKIIVNVSTTPGAYSMKYSFIYLTEDGTKIIDDQVVTLLIYRLPNIEVGFYQDPGLLFAFQPNNLPLQITNMSRSSVVLGSMEVQADNATLENNTAIVGPIEAGFYFTLDTMIIPDESGPLTLRVLINYTDDFNQPRVHEATLDLEVIEMESMPEPGYPGEYGEEMGPDVVGPGEMPDGGTGSTETFWQKIVRFFRGLFGLGSGQKNEIPQDYPMEVPMERPIIEP